MRIDIGDGVRLFVDIDGMGLVPIDGRLEQRPTLLLLHGGPGIDHAPMKMGLGELRDVAQVVWFDHRGHGRSDWRTPDEWNLDTWADDVVRLCDALGIEHPIVFGGSFGGFVAQRYIGRHPDHPAKVVLGSTVARWQLQPVLVMAGELDPVCPIAGTEELVAHLPADLVQFRRFANCGHGVFRDDKEGALAAMRAFITA
jgi:proline iminopeptidase